MIEIVLFNFIASFEAEIKKKRKKVMRLHIALKLYCFLNLKEKIIKCTSILMSYVILTNPIQSTI